MLLKHIPIVFLAALVLSSSAVAIQPDEEVIVRGQRLSEIEFDLPRYTIEFIEETAAQARGRGFAR